MAQNDLELKQQTNKRKNKQTHGVLGQHFNKVLNCEFYLQFGLAPRNTLHSGTVEQTAGFN